MLDAIRHRGELIAWTLFLCLSLPIIVWLPEKMVQSVYRGDHDRSVESSSNYAKLVDDYRKTTVQTIGGILLLYTLYLNQRRTKATESALVATLKTLAVTKETQITDRFTKAIAQLGATDAQGNRQVEIRFGGIYALERISHDSPVDHWPIMEILTAYVRQNAKSRLAWRNEGEEYYFDVDKDIQAIMTVIGRCDRKHDKGRLELSNVDIRGVNLSGAQFTRAYFLQADLEECDFSNAGLEEADFWKARLQAADFTASDLRRAIFLGARLEEADFTRAHVEGADFRYSTPAQSQIAEANGDAETKLPDGLTSPAHWSKNAS